MTGSFDPWDPFGVLRATTEAAARVQAQAQEAARQARLNAAKADVTAAFAAWSNQPDGPASENLRGAVEAFLTALEA